MRPINSSIITTLAAFAFCIWQAVDLFIGWVSYTAHFFGWIALIIWGVPLVLYLIQRIAQKQRFYVNPFLILLGPAVAFIGMKVSLHVLQHVGLSLCFLALLPLRITSLTWWAGAGLWMPAWEWLWGRFFPDTVLFSRLLFASGLTLGVSFQILRYSNFKPKFSPLNPKIAWGILLMLLTLSLWDQYAPPPKGRITEDTLPRAGIRFTSFEMNKMDLEREIYDRTITAKRYYQFGRHRFILIVVDGTNNRHAIHDPVYCFRGAGWQIITTQSYKIENGFARYLKLKKQDDIREAVFWFSNRRFRYTSILRYWFDSALRRFTFGLSGQEPILIILQSMGDNVPNWREVLDRFGVLYEL